MFVGIIIFLAKTGGLDAEQKFLLFFDLRVQRHLSYLVFPLHPLGYLIAVGRHLFPGFLLMVAMETSMEQVMVRWKSKYLIAMILPLLTLVLYHPKIFLSYFSISTQLIIINLTIIWIALYLVMAMVLLWREYRDITIPFCKRQFRAISIFLLSITFLYVIFFRQDPIQVYKMYSAEYLQFGGTLYSTSNGGSSHLAAFSVITAILSIFGFISLRRYSATIYEENRGDVMIQRKMDMASQGLSVFVHGMKNQLLANRVLHTKMRNHLQQVEPDIAQLSKQVQQLEEINLNMLTRMEEVYRSIKSNRMTLVPVPAGKLLEEVMQKFNQKYPEAQVDLSHPVEFSEIMILADTTHLSEAIYNLLTNAYESTADLQHSQREVKLIGRIERLYLSFEVSDNGKGITHQQQKKIFEPFYTSKSTTHNWGLGLFYVKQIVRNHYGILRVESQVGEGTKFYLAIPKYGTPQHKSRR